MYYDGNCCILFIRSFLKAKKKRNMEETNIGNRKTQLLCQANFGILVTKLLLGGIWPEM